ncbi:MAG: phosphoribosylglycinamide synthetase C domain-containing protein, partial [Patescibacteria group bacterium]
GIQDADSLEGVKIFHAGTAEKDCDIVTNGGRVLGVTALGATIADAQRNAYEAVSKIRFNNAHFRTDIGWRAVGR